MKTIQLSTGQKIQFDGNPTDAEIQEVVSQMTKNAAPKTDDASLVGEILRPAGRLGASAIQAGKGVLAANKTAAELISAPFRSDITLEDAARRGSQRFEDIEKKSTQGFEWFGGTVRPIGFNKEGALTPVRAAADAAGVGLELGSTLFSPIKTPGAGFFSTAIKNIGSKASLTFGIGTGLQEFAKTGDAGEGAQQAAFDTIGSAAGFSLFNKGGQMFSKFGGKLLQNEVVQNQAQVAKDFAEKTYIALQDWFKAPRQTVTDIKNSQNFKETYDGLETEFRQDLQKSADGFLDAVKVDYTRDPDVMTRGITSKIQNEINGAFDVSRTTYKTFDNAGVDIAPGAKAQSVFNAEDFKITPAKLLESVDDNTKTIVNSMLKKGESVDSITNALRSMGVKVEVAGQDDFVRFMSNISENLAKGVKPSEFLNTAYKLFNIGKTFPPEQAAIAREYANAMFVDGREKLINEGRQDLVDLWDKGSVQWKQALAISNSNTLNNLIDSGKIDNFISKAVGDTQKLTLDEKKILEKAFTENPKETQELFTNGIVDRVKEIIKPPKNGVASKAQFEAAADLIDNFLNNKGVLTWGDYALSRENNEFLRNISSFLKTEFDDLLNRQKQIAGAIPEDEELLLDMMVKKGRLDMAEALRGKDFTNFAESFVNLVYKNPVDMGMFIREMSPESKKIASVSIMNKMFDENVPAFVMRPDGKFSLTDDNFIPAMEKVYQNIKNLQFRTKDDTVYGLFDKDMLTEMDDVMQTINRYKNIAQLEPFADMRKIVDGIMGSFYAYRMWFPGAAARYEKVLASDPELVELSKQQLYQEIERLGKQNGIVTIGDFLQAAAKFPPFRVAAPKLYESSEMDNNQ